MREERRIGKVGGKGKEERNGNKKKKKRRRCEGREEANEEMREGD